jgi:hypothetical protein
MALSFLGSFPFPSFAASGGRHALIVSPLGQKEKKGEKVETSGH